MKIVYTGQPKGGPKNKPVLIKPVIVTLDVPVYYYDGTHFSATPDIICDEAHAHIVYTMMNVWAVRYNFSIVHLGTYYPRQARHEDGTLILHNGKPRWSGHSYGACDWTGIMVADNHKLFYNTEKLRTDAPHKFNELLENIRAEAGKHNRHTEIVRESHWYHLGLIPVGGW